MNRSVVQQEENQLGLMRRALPIARDLLELARSWRDEAEEAAAAAESIDAVDKFANALGNAVREFARSIEKVESGEI